MTRRRILSRAVVVPKANNQTFLSNEYIEKTRALVEEFGAIPVINFASFWDIKYEECIDFVKLRCNDGLIGFLRQNHHLFDLSYDEVGFATVSLISRPVSRDSSNADAGAGENALHDSIVAAVNKRRQINRTIHRLFNPNSLLWSNPACRDILHVRDISIASSAYEMALDVNAVQTRKMETQIRVVLQKATRGLRITEVYRYINTTQALRIFSVTSSIVALIDELPELFYRKRTNDSCDDLVFDGFTHTIPDLTGRDDSMFVGGQPAKKIVTRAINDGLYQKTLLLMRETGQVRGLKINVWMRSIQRNFYAKNQDAFERETRGINTLTFFLALAQFDLVELRSHPDIKNDIRAFFPRTQVDWFDLKARLVDLASLDSNSEGPDSCNDEPDDLRMRADGWKTIW